MIQSQRSRHLTRNSGARGYDPTNSGERMTASHPTEIPRLVLGNDRKGAFGDEPERRECNRDFSVLLVRNAWRCFGQSPWLRLLAVHDEVDNRAHRAAIRVCVPVRYGGETFSIVWTQILATSVIGGVYFAPLSAAFAVSFSAAK